MREASSISYSPVKLAFIGAGRMAEAIISGLLTGEALTATDIIAADVDSGRLDNIRERYGIAVTTENIAAARAAEFILLAVKPQHFDEAVREIKGALTEAHTLITIAAGVSVDRVRSLIEIDLPIVRVMPNTPALVNAGISAVAFPREISDENRTFVERLLSTVGAVVRVDESDMNAVTAVSGSGPAYFFLFVRAIAKAGVELGLDEELAVRLARQTFYGSARLLEAGDADEDDLIAAVASPGGTTEAALKSFARDRLEEVVARAAGSAAVRAEELDS